MKLILDILFGLFAVFVMVLGIIWSFSNGLSVVERFIILAGVAHLYWVQDRIGRD